MQSFFNDFPLKSFKISGFSIAGRVMTVQDELIKAMPQTASTRSRFMITDILSGAGGGGARELGVRSPSPGPRDLSLHSAAAAAALHHQPDSDTDSSGHPDNSSVCSNGKCFLKGKILFIF